jgi:hypothetical protein
MHSSETTVRSTDHVPANVIVSGTVLVVVVLVLVVVGLVGLVVVGLVDVVGIVVTGGAVVDEEELVVVVATTWQSVWPRLQAFQMRLRHFFSLPFRSPTQSVWMNCPQARLHALRVAPSADEPPASRRIRSARMANDDACMNWRIRCCGGSERE